MTRPKLTRWTTLGLLAAATAAPVCRAQPVAGADEAAAPTPTQGPAPSSDRADVIRRLWLDVAGRPPTRQELDEVLRDPSPRAYQAALDRLTARDSAAASPAPAAPPLPATSLPPAVPPTPLRGLTSPPPPPRVVPQARTVENRPRTLQVRSKDAAAATSALHEVGVQAVARPTVTAKPLPPSPAPPGPYVTLSGSALRATFAAKRTKAAYLGVGVEPPGDVLRSQLRLPDGAGLVVNHVDPDGPAKDVLKPHDVLQRLADQILVNPEQLVTLVRMRKPGETVPLTLLRQAKEVTVEVKVGEREVAADAGPLQPLATADYDTIDYNNTINYRTIPVHIDKSIRWAGSDLSVALNRAAPREPAAALSAVRAGPIRVEDGKWVLVVSPDAGGELTLIDADSGVQVFKGPPLVGEDDPRAKDLPADARQKLILWQGAARPLGVVAADGLSVELSTDASTSTPAASTRPAARSGEPKE